MNSVRTQRVGANVASVLGLAALLVGCPPPTDIMEGGTDVQDTGADAQGVDTVTPMDVQNPDVVTPDVVGDATSDSGDSGMLPCPASPAPIDVTGNITASASWTCMNTYILRDNSPTFITNSAVLTIGPGTVIHGAAPRSSLIATRGTRIEAAGTRAQPIVFTSNRPVGMRRQQDWGGVALLGRASINEGRTAPPVPGVNVLEGLMPSEESNGAYGGGATPDDNDNSGTFRYVRVEFAGQELSPNNELNGLTLAGVGRGTTIDFVQVHRAADDGVECFGGTVNLRHLVLTQNEDDGFDWDQGYRGRAQFVIIQGIRISSESDPGGIEADNDRNVNTAAPIAEPLLYNFTVIGPGHDVMVTYQNRGVVLRRGTAGRIFNMIVQGWPTGGIDVRDMSTFDLANSSLARLAFGSTILFNNGTGGTGHFFEGTSVDAFDEMAWFTGGSMNRVQVDPMLPAPFSEMAPNWVPPASSPCASMGATPPSAPDMGFAFDPTATFVGAIRPGENDNWTTGWTAYPAN